MDTEKKAQKLINDAEKKLNSWSLFTPKSQKLEDAAELYKEAANVYKTDGEWKKSGDIYLKAASMFEQSSSHEAANCYVEAAKAFKKVSSSDACEAYDKAVAHYTNKGRHSTAARICKDMGEIYEKDSKYDLALKSFEKSAKYYLASDQPINANHQLLKVADLATRLSNPDYKKAIEIYEKVARDSLDNSSLRYSVRTYLFKATLCSMAQSVKANDTKGLSDTIEKYKDLDPDFDGSVECKFVEEIIPLMETGEEDKYQNCVKAFNKRKRLDDWTVEILLDVKNHLKKVVTTDELDIS